MQPLTTVTAVRPRRPGRPERGYRVTTEAHRGVAAQATGARSPPAQVVFAAGALGTQRLLHPMRDEGDLPRLSARLG